MSKQQKTSKAQNGIAAVARSRFDIPISNIEVVSDCPVGTQAQRSELRISSFRRGRLRGFNFTEVMFAIIILGIGFIMVAAIFPVALQQAKTTSEEIGAATIARGAASAIEAAMSDKAGTSTVAKDATNVVPTGPGPISIPPKPALVQQISTIIPGGGVSLWNSVCGNMINADDPRYAWTFVYRREGLADDASTWQSVAQVYIFPLQARAAAQFATTDDAPFQGAALPASAYVPNLMPRPVQVVILDEKTTGLNVDLIAFDLASPPPGPLRNNVEAAAEGAYVVIANDKLAAANQGRMNGRVYRLGARRSELDGNSIFVVNRSIVYELVPGGDFSQDPGVDGILNNADDLKNIGLTTDTPAPSGTADAFLVGRGYASPPDPDGDGIPQYDGTAMPVGVYVTWVKVNK
jgi:Tfp pilus assembly protein PilV